VQQLMAGSSRFGRLFLAMLNKPAHTHTPYTPCTPAPKTHTYVYTYPCTYEYTVTQHVSLHTCNLSNRILSRNPFVLTTLLPTCSVMLWPSGSGGTRKPAMRLACGRMMEVRAEGVLGPSHSANALPCFKLNPHPSQRLTHTRNAGFKPNIYVKWMWVFIRTPSRPSPIQLVVFIPLPSRTLYAPPTTHSLN